MFKKMIIAGCTVAMFGMTGLGTVQNAEAAVWRTPRRTRIVRRYRDARQDFRQAERRYDRVERQFDNSFRYNRRSPYRYRGYGGYRGYNNGFIRTPYFSIGF